MPDFANSPKSCYFIEEIIADRPEEIDSRSDEFWIVASRFEFGDGFESIGDGYGHFCYVGAACIAEIVTVESDRAPVWEVGPSIDYVITLEMEARFRWDEVTAAPYYLLHRYIVLDTSTEF